MQLVDALLTTAYEDTQLLLKNDELGDSFRHPRDVEFVFLTDDKAKAETVASFVDDNRYGVPWIQEIEGTFRLIVSVNMPITQHVLCSVSALMVCLAELFSIEYDGWGCVVQTGQPSVPVDASGAAEQ